MITILDDVIKIKFNSDRTAGILNLNSVIDASSDIGLITMRGYIDPHKGEEVVHSRTHLIEVVADAEDGRVAVVPITFYNRVGPMKVKSECQFDHKIFRSVAMDLAGVLGINNFGYTKDSVVMYLDKN